jgi:dipeptidyl aminopeptidase/acylaminoacyl peptidase
MIVDDLLRRRFWGQALIDPTGRWLVFEQTPRYDQVPDYSIHWSSTATAPDFGQIMVIDLTASATPKLLFAPEPQTLYRIHSFSPDGQRLALYSVRQGKVRFGTYEMSSWKMKSFKETPALDFYDINVVWVSNEELVYAALPDDKMPLASQRRYIGEWLYKAWNRTWEGKEPSATVLASYADGGGKDFLPGKLVKANARTGTSEVLANGLYVDLKKSFDGRFIAGLRQTDGMQMSADRPMGEDWAHFQLLVVDLQSGKSRAVAPEMWVSPGSMAWSPTSESLGFFGWKKDSERHTGLFYGYDANTEKILAWPHNGLDLATGGYFQRPGQKPQRVAWLNNRMAVVARANPKGDETPRFTDRGFAARNDVGQGKADWYLLSPAGGGQNLTAEFSEIAPVPVSVTPQGLNLLLDGSVWEIAPDGSKTNLTSSLPDGLDRAIHELRTEYWQNIPFVTRGQSGLKKYVLFEKSTGKIATFPMPSEHARLMNGSVRAEVTLFREETDEGFRLLLQRAQGAPIEVGNMNRHLAGISMPELKTISYRVKSDRELRSAMFLPYGYTPGKRYPVVVEIYPSTPSGVTPRFSLAGFRGSYAPQLLAAKGYIVFFAANPSDLNRTKDGPIAGMSDVVLSGVDALVAQGYADPDRICLFGLSQGGISSLWLATQTDRFKAIASLHGWADLASHYFDRGILGTFYPDTYPLDGGSAFYDAVGGSVFGIGETPFQNPGIYFRNSPVYQADKVKTPILLVHTDMDDFSVGQYQEMFGALYRLRKEARFVRYWGETHGPASPANTRDLWYRVFAWFDEWTDVSRDKKGNIVWEGDKVKSRNGSVPLKPEDFARFDQAISGDSQSKPQSIQKSR